MPKIPKYVEAALKRRVKAAEALNASNRILEGYCRKIGMDVTGNLDTAALGSSWMVLTEPQAAYSMTLNAIKRAISENADQRNKSGGTQHDERRI